MNTKLRSIAAVLAATGAAFGALAIGAPAAQASMNDCPASQICAWTAPDYKGYMGHWVGNAANWNNRIENKDSSWFNNATGTGNTSVRIYTKHNYTGEYFCLDKGEYDNYDSYWGDKGSSHKWVNPSDC
ncbi:peptidase inhibitor family I36 protein [Streptomyces sp. NPDC056255]|uniref:peptidase inhibitor family I36 protein n=1 Tax=Streptomyces sp. NPDC056255 TaxID=3345764 RepID=UPI0035DC5984